MEYKVKSGEQFATVTLDGTECEVKFVSPYRGFEIKNNSNGDVIISLKKGVSEGDGTVKISVGECVNYMHSPITDTLYLTGSGEVIIAAKNGGNQVFKRVLKGGENGDIDIKDKKIILFALKTAVFNFGIPELFTNITENTPTEKWSEIFREQIKKYDFYVDYSGVIFEYSDRTVSRETDLPAYCAYWHTKSSNWFVPLVISEYEEGVAYTMYNKTFTSQGSFEADGKTWYYNSQNYGSYSGAADSSEYNRYCLGNFSEPLDVVIVKNFYEGLKSLNIIREG